ncbi:YcxB family protein [Candidatus Methylocalor cossyra]|uniref:YcxB domain-containing protein n=1 Tax=Candidatus Methylocalor cossyra TaxID=3108543 RepID=A0ABP1C745_9GAMM
MAEIEYEVREQDLIAYGEHQMRDSEALQKLLRRHQGMIPGLMGVFALFLWFYYQDSLSAIYVGLLALAWGFLAPLFVRWQMRQQIRKTYSDEEKAQVLGRYTLRSEPEALVEISRAGESRIRWGDILRVEVTKRYAFIFVAIDAALIIPRATVKAGDLHEFVKEVDRLIEKAS